MRSKELHELNGSDYKQIRKYIISFEVSVLVLTRA